MTNSNNPLNPTPIKETQIESTLIKTHKSENLTDTKILAESHQIIPTQDRLEDETNAVGSMIEHLGVAHKQWDFSVNWQRTNVPKSGIFNKLKNKTEILDLDLACLLCNRYGEVIEKVWFKNVRDKAESIRHHGDELLGKSPLSETMAADISDKKTADYSHLTTDKNTNQEKISLYFSRIPPQIFHLVFVLSSYQGHDLSLAQQGICSLTDDEGNIIHEFHLNTLNSPAVRVATLTRSSDSWRYHTDMAALTHYKLPEITEHISQSLVRTAK